MPDDIRLGFLQTPTESELEFLASGTGARRGSMLRELQEVGETLKLRGIEVIPFHPSDLTPVMDALPSTQVFVAADLGVCWRLLQHLGITDRLAGSYPAALHSFLNRRTWHGTVQELTRLPELDGNPVFVKPCRLRVFDGTRYSGQVVSSAAALRSVHPSFKGETFFCSEPVDWLSEYRCYVLHSEILGIYPYAVGGLPIYRVDCAELERLKPDFRPSVELVRSAIERLEQAEQSVSGYSLDFGLTSAGEMSLIEMNDGLALLNYGLAADAYLDLHLARWKELMEMCPARF